MSVRLLFSFCRFLTRTNGFPAGLSRFRFAVFVRYAENALSSVYFRPCVPSSKNDWNEPVLIICVVCSRVFCVGYYLSVRGEAFSFFGQNMDKSGLL